MTDLKYLIITDLDGTLLNYETFSYKPIVPFIKKIISKKILIIPNTSKTKDEVLKFLNEIKYPTPFIVESGSAIYFPKKFNYSRKMKINDFELIYSSKNKKSIHKILDSKDFQNYKSLFRITNEIKNTDLADLSGLSIENLKDIKKRDFSELIVWDSSKKNLNKFKMLLNKKDLSLLEGARFLHLKGRGDKGIAIHKLLKFMKSSKINVNKTISLGDSINDIPMLRRTDFSCIIKLPNKNYINFKGESVFRSKKEAPLGWKEALMSIGEFADYVYR